jgi:outer membrane autotransporter protein
MLDAGGIALFRHCAAAIRAANAVSDGDYSAPRNVLDQITPQEVISQDAVISGAVAPQTAAVSARINAMSRFAIGSGDVAMTKRPIQLALNEPDGDVRSDVTPATAADRAQRLQTFATLTYSGGKQTPTALESGFDIHLGSITAGADYRFGPAITAGIAGGYGQTKLDFSNGGGRLRTRVLSLSAYALAQPSARFDLTLLIAFSRVRYRSVRQIAYTADSDSVTGSTLGKTTGNQFEASAGSIYNLGSGGWTFGPAAQLTFTQLEISAFDERATGTVVGLEYSFPHQTARSLQIALGFDVARAISTGFAIVSPYGRVRAIAETLDKRRTIAMKYVNDRVSSFGQTMTTAATDRDRFILGGGIAAQFSRGASAFVDGQTLLGLSNISQYSLSMGARLAF